MKALVGVVFALYWATSLGQEGISYSIDSPVPPNTPVQEKSYNLDTNTTTKRTPVEPEVTSPLALNQSKPMPAEKGSDTTLLTTRPLQDEQVAKLLKRIDELAYALQTATQEDPCEDENNLRIGLMILEKIVNDKVALSLIVSSFLCLTLAAVIMCLCCWKSKITNLKMFTSTILLLKNQPLHTG
jgi:hypothetical protein